MLPAIFNENLFDNFFDDDFMMPSMFGKNDPLYGKHAKNVMKTDVRETDSSTAAILPSAPPRVLKRTKRKRRTASTSDVSVTRVSAAGASM